MSFGKDFLWGAATSSYQIEGAAFEDGKGLSIWDMMCRKPGAIWRGDDGFTACDHYHRFREDVAIMKQIGLKAYRFSLSWPRILPEGVGKINEAGIDFYSRLVDELLAAGVEPFITLFHWDYPYELYLRGGWLNSDSPRWFGDYTRAVVERLSDRVRNWITLNEPQCFIGQGHLLGIHAPGDKLGMREMLLASHHALLAHGRAVQAIRAHSKTKANVGYAPVAFAKIPVSKAQADIDAARAATFSVTGGDFWNSTWWIDPVFLGSYPADGLEQYGDKAPRVGAGDMAVIGEPIDFCGMNLYFSARVRAGEDGRACEVPNERGYPKAAYDHWPITPECMYWGPKFFYERYKKPIIITENGIANIDNVSLDGRVHDPQRIDFIQRHLRHLEGAMEDGVDVRGYFHWSLMDNFEWAAGYSARFGLVHVDYQTQKRTLKDSAYWYGDVIKGIKAL